MSQKKRSNRGSTDIKEDNATLVLQILELLNDDAVLNKLNVLFTKGLADTLLSKITTLFDQLKDKDAQIYRLTLYTRPCTESVVGDR